MGLDRDILASRSAVYEAAKQANPARWRNWLNPDNLHEEVTEKERCAA